MDFDVQHIACMAGRRRGEKGSKGMWEYRGKEDGTACKDAIVFLVFFVHQMDVKILIGQIL